MTRPIAAIVLCAGGLLIATPALAQQNTDLVRAQRFYERLNFKGCREAAARALKRPGNRKRDLVDIYRLSGLCAAALNDEEAANAAFSRLLAIDPTFRLDPDLSPQLTSPFKEAKGVMSARRPIGARLVPPPVTLRPSQPNQLWIEVEDPLKMVGEVRFAYRRALQGDFTTLTTTRVGNRALVALPPVGDADATRAVLEYYVELRDPNGGELGGAGSQASPLRVTIGDPFRGPVAGSSGGDTAEPRRPVYKRAWFWVVVGGLAAGGAITAGLVARPSGQVDLRSGVDFAR